MKDVAAVAGVSLSTVSRVVNGSPPVAPELAVKVERAVEMLGYRHNHTAGTLRRANGLSASIGLIFEDVSNPFFSAHPPRRRGRRPHALGRDVRRQLRRGPGARARARRGVLAAASTA